MSTMTFVELKTLYDKIYLMLSAVFNLMSERESQMDTQRKVIANFLAVRTIRSTHSIRLLVQAGYAEDVVSLSRNFYESSLLLQYIDQKAHDDEVNKMAAMALVKQYEVEKAMQVSSKTFHVTEDHANETKKLYDDARELLGGKDYKFEWWRYAEAIEKDSFYKAMYPFMSAFTHPDVFIAHLYLEEQEDGSNLADPNKTDHEGALQFGIQTAVFIADILEAFNNITSAGLPKERFEEIRILAHSPTSTSLET